MDNFDEIIAGASRYGRAGASIVGEEAKRIIAGLRADLAASEKQVDRCLGEIRRVFEAVGVDPVTFCAHEVKQKYDAAVDRAKKAEGLLRDSRRAHYECEDGWYSCPKAPNFFGNGTECECGADQWNARIDEHLRA